MDFLLFLLLASIALILLGVPVGLVLAIANVFALIYSDISLSTLVQVSYSTLGNPLLLAVPFFIFCGSLMANTSAAERLTNFVTLVVRRIRGGLGMSAVASTVLFSDISASATSDAAAVGSVMIPTMSRNGYRPAYATALQAASGSLGLLVPPSLTAIIYAFVANVSIGELSLACIVPALFIAGTFMFVNYIVARREDIQPGPAPRLRELGTSLQRGILILIVPVIILGGILAGVFTPAEAGAVSVAYVLVLNLVIYRDLSWSGFMAAVREAIAVTSRVGLLVGMAIVLGTILSIHLIPQKVAGSLLGVSTDKLVVLFLINVLLIVLHTVIETSSAILIVVPVLLPVLTSLNVDPIHFGVILFVNSAIGITLPPIGFCLYVCCSISNVAIERAAAAMIPFTIALVVDLVIITVFPQITLFVL